jgi:ABC-type multidrug transport system ATPase subunit
VVSGEALVDGRLRDISFQRKTGYAQQQDIHLETMTVREALRFNAILCQPARVSRKEKFTFVEDVIQVLGMEAYADAIIGVPGEGVLHIHIFVQAHLNANFWKVLMWSSERS